MTVTPEEIKSEAAVRETARKTAASLRYSTGFGNEHASEALVGALPIGRNNPQRPAYGLYTELLSETAFTELRHNTRRTWLYRIRPSTVHPPFERIDSGSLLAPPFGRSPWSPTRSTGRRGRLLPPERISSPVCGPWEETAIPPSARAWPSTFTRQTPR